MKNERTLPESNKLAETIRSHLDVLCCNITNRHVGCPGNRMATDYFAAAIATFGFQVESQPFDCIDWEYGPLTLDVGNDSFAARVGPYSPACSLTALLVGISTVDELERSDIAGKIALLHGEIAREQLMPKGFIFYNPDHHRRIVAMLEEKRPAAIVAATIRNPETAGAVYPFPLIEDGDIDIPSAYMTDREGDHLLKHAGGEATLCFDSRRIPARGCNVIARSGPTGAPRIVFCAHIDTKKNTPGALDNAGGVATLLALAGLLAGYSGRLGIEIVAMNGEDYYAVPGEMLYLRQNQTTFSDIQLAVNLDAAGANGSRSVYSSYECPPKLKALLHDTLEREHSIPEGPAWPQSDHMIFVQHSVPAAAITSENFSELCAQVTHTEKDTLEGVDCRQLAGVAVALRDLVSEMSAID